MLLNLLFENEVKSIVFADSKFVGDFFSIFAAIDVKNEFLPRKYMIFIEGTGSLFFVLALSKHIANYNWLTLPKNIRTGSAHENKFLLQILVLYTFLDILSMDNNIPDDPAVAQPVFEELRNNFKLNIVQNVEFREKALSQLIEGYKALQSEFDEALKHDNGYNPFMSNFVAHSITLSEITDLLNNISNWTKPRPVPTPIGMEDNT